MYVQNGKKHISGCYDYALLCLTTSRNSAVKIMIKPYKYIIKIAGKSRVWSHLQNQVNETKFIMKRLKKDCIHETHVREYKAKNSMIYFPNES